MSSRDALKRACATAGSQLRLARSIGTTQSRVSYWLVKSRNGVSAEFVLPIERVTGVSRHELRPDLYPDDADSSRAGASV